MKTLYYKNIKLDNYYGKVNRIAHTRRTKKYEQWQAWLTDYAKKFHNNSNKRKLDITQIMSEIDNMISAMCQANLIK